MGIYLMISFHLTLSEIEKQQRNTLVFTVDISNQKVTQGNTETEKQNYAFFEANQLSMTCILQNKQPVRSFPCVVLFFRGVY